MRVPWPPAQDHAFEEWYVVDDSAALDTLNDSAVFGRCRWRLFLAPRRSGTAFTAERSVVLKPDGMPYQT